MVLNNFNEIDDSRYDFILNYINSYSDLSNFSKNSTKILSQPLDFYPEYLFLSITDYKEIPVKQLSVLYKDQEIYILKKSKNFIYSLNKTLPFILNKKTILTYIRFFFTHGFEEKDKFKIVDTSEHISWQDGFNPDARRAIGKMISPLEFKTMDQENNFVCLATVVYKRSLFGIKILVSHEGIIKIVDQELIVEDIPVEEDL